MTNESIVGEGLGGRRLTHVAFADDMTLVARSWLSLKRMVLLLRDKLRQKGLALHPSKCKAQTNISDWTKRGLINISAGFALNILEEGKPLEVLGTQLS